MPIPKAQFLQMVFLLIIAAICVGLLLVLPAYKLFLLTGAGFCSLLVGIICIKYQRWVAALCLLSSLLVGSSQVFKGYALLLFGLAFAANIIGLILASKDVGRSRNQI